MKLDKYNEYLVSTVATDGLVLQHQGISSHSVDYTFIQFQLFMNEYVVRLHVLSLPVL